MTPATPDLDLVSEFAVPYDATAPQLTGYVRALFDEQVRLVALLHQRMITDLERQASHVRSAVRDAWLTKNRPAAEAGEPSAIRRQFARRPACPKDSERSELPDFRAERRYRGVYLRLRPSYHLAVEMWAVDTNGNAIAEVNVLDDTAGRFDAARYLWSVLERLDPVGGNPARS
jgi:hypothetical protein